MIYAIPYVMIGPSSSRSHAKSHANNHLLLSLFFPFSSLFRETLIGTAYSYCSSRIPITELSTTEFLIRPPPILSPINELKRSIESSKGIYPTSIHSSPIIPSSIVPNDYSTSNQLNKFRRYINIGDPIAVSGPIDLVSGSVDLGCIVIPSFLLSLLYLFLLYSLSTIDTQNIHGLRQLIIQ